MKVAVVLVISVLVVGAFAQSPLWASTCTHAFPEDSLKVSPVDARVRYYGRVAVNTGVTTFDWNGTGFQVRFTNATQAWISLVDNYSEYTVFLDGQAVSLIATNSSCLYFKLFEHSLNPKLTYVFRIARRTEAQNSPYPGRLQGIYFSQGAIIQAPAEPFPTRRLEFFGDSITCGYGNLANSSSCTLNPQIQLEDNWWSWGPIISRHFDALYHIESWSGKGLVRNFADPNKTSVDPMPIYWNRTIATVANEFIYNFTNYIPDAVIVNLGTNDFSTQPTPDPSVFMSAYVNLIQTIRSSYHNPNLPIFAACGPMIANPCCSYVRTVADSTPNVHFVNLQNILLSNEYGCAGHPNILGHQKMAAIAAPIIAKVLHW